MIWVCEQLSYGTLHLLIPKSDKKNERLFGNHAGQTSFFTAPQGQLPFFLTMHGATYDVVQVLLLIM